MKEAPNGMGDFASLDPQDQTSCGSALWLKAASWKAAISHSTSGVAEYQSLPCVKGGGVRKDTGGIDAEQFTFCNANSDYSMSENRTAHNRKPHAKTNRWGTIPQSAKLTAPFTQRGLWCGAPPEVLWKLEIAQQGRRIAAPVTSVTGSQ